MIISNDKYFMTEIPNSYYSVQMKLIIRRFHKADLGGYKCISKNSIGDAEGTIRLYGKPTKSPPTYRYDLRPLRTTKRWWDFTRIRDNKTGLVFFF